MLKELFIQNIILMDAARISFGPGLNVISGETGSGKSAILESLLLILGGRSDPQLIRHGEENGRVEAVFDIEKCEAVQILLKEAGLLGDDATLLIIQRELFLSGKSKAYVNHRSAQIGTLKSIGSRLAEIVSQHGNQKLLESNYQREALDLFAGHFALLESYRMLWQETSVLKNREAQLQEEMPSSLRELDACRNEIEEIENGKLKEGEEEELFSRFSLLTTIEERKKSAEEIEAAFTHDKGVLSLFKKIKGAINYLTQKDPSLKDTLDNFQNLVLECEEIAYAMGKYLAGLDVDPEELEKMEVRLKEIHKLKKKYGATIPEIKSHLIRKKAREKELKEIDQELERIRERLLKSEENLKIAAALLSKSRMQHAKALGTKITQELAGLNMGGGQFQIRINPQPPSSSGSDEVDFFLGGNTGERSVSLKEGASGGELARALLALHVILAGKEGTSTLVFDEVDASIGGKTAAIIGEKLKTLGQSHQVLCITHFPQVAEKADHHIQISKTIAEGRTLSRVARLDLAEREKELLRMAGK